MRAVNEKTNNGQEKESQTRENQAWTLLHDQSEWKAYARKCGNHELRSWYHHEPSAPESFPCLVNTSQINWAFHHRFVCLNDAYRLLLSSGQPEIQQPFFLH